MADIRSKVNTFYSLEQLAAGDTGIHRVLPLPKMLVTLVYLVCLLSLGRCALHRVAPYLFYPVVVMTLAGIPCGMIFRRALVALPFCLFAGLSNLLLDRTPLLRLGALTVSAGAASFAVLLARTLLCVGAVLILVAVTPFPRLTDTLRRLRMPELLVTLIEMVYRYTGILLEEAADMLTAFRLRAGGARWPRLREFGPFVGQLLLRSADRAERVYQAMQCRGYRLRGKTGRREVWHGRDWAFFLLGAGSAVLFRCFDLISLLGGALR